MRPLRPWQRLQWRLTLACVGATLGLALLLEVAVLGALGLYLLRSEDMAVEVAREALGRATLLAPALAAQPPDVAALERVFAGELRQAVAPQPRRSSALEVQVHLGSPGAGTVAVLDAAGAPLLAVDYSQTGASRAAFASAPEEDVLIRRALAGVTEPESLGVRGDDGSLLAAVPVRDAAG
ncbi:MAG TPA: hypothetical protein VE153_41270, partial [Myxococcus sp.]|nr:hypothetical protein [Myxococcus sp.]